VVTRGLLGSVLMLLGGWVIAYLPVSVAAPWPLGVARVVPGGALTGVAAVLLGLLLLAYAWGELLHRSHVAPDLGAVWRCATTWCAPLLVAPPLFSRDGWAYAGQGGLAASGLSPYEYGPDLLDGSLSVVVDPLWRDTPAPYGPVPLTYGAWLTQVTTDPLLLVLVHRVVLMAGLVLLAWAVPRLARATGVLEEPASAVALASPLVLATGVGGMHNDLLMVGLMAAAVAIALEHHWVSGAVVAGLAAAVKAPGLAAALVVALVSLPAGAALGVRVRRLVQVGAIAVSVLVGLGVVTGLGVGWLHAASMTDLELTALSPLRLVPPDLRGLGSPVPVLLGGVLALRTPTGDADRALRALCAVLLAALLLGAAVRVWYFLWPLPFLAVLPVVPLTRRLVIGAVVVLGLTPPLTEGRGGDLAPVLAPALAALALTIWAVSHLVSPRLRDRWRGRPLQRTDSGSGSTMAA